MSPKYSAAVLSVVALSAWSASSMATAGLLLQDIIPSSYASGEMNAPHVQVSSNQRSKSNADLTARNSTDEERGPQPLSISGNGPEGTMQSLLRQFHHIIDQKGYFFSYLRAKNNGDLKRVSRKAINKVFPRLVKIFKDHLASVLLAESEMDGARQKIVEALLNKMVTVWINDDTYNPERVFKILELDEANSNLFEHPHFLIWASYVKSKYRNLNEAYEMMFATLKPFYQGDDLCTVLAARVKIMNTRDIASELMNIQLKEWKTQRKSAMDVFTLLKLEQTEGNLFESRIFMKWKRYIRPETYLTYEFLWIMFTVLEKVHGDRLPSILLAGTKIESTQELANSLLEIQFQSWKISAKDASTVFELLGFKQTEGNLFDNPLFLKWKNHFESTTSLSNTDDYWGKIYVALKNMYCDRLAGDLEGTTTESTRTFAKKLLDMDKDWETKAQGAIKRFTELGLKRTQGNLFGSPSYTKWLVEVKKIFQEDTPMHTFAILQQLFSHDELFDVLLRGVLDKDTRLTVLELIPNPSFKEAVMDGVYRYVGLKS